MLVREMKIKCILSIDRCREVIKLARKYNLLVLCDDVYNLLHFPDKTAPQRLFTYDDKYVVCNISLIFVGFEDKLPSLIITLYCILYAYCIIHFCMFKTNLQFTITQWSKVPFSPTTLTISSMTQSNLIKMNQCSFILICILV